jgi:hypothetical protein
MNYNNTFAEALEIDDRKPAASFIQIYSLCCCWIVGLIHRFWLDLLKQRKAAA